MNSLGLPWKMINTFYPELSGVYKGRGYTREEIQKLLEYSNDIQTDFIILAQSSGGLRIGAWDDLKWGNVFPIYQIEDQFKIELEKDEIGKVVCAAIIIHQGTAFEYTALISIEAWEKLQEYKKLWTKKQQRPPTNKDPLLVTRFANMIPLTSSAIRARIGKLVEKAGLRIPLTEGNRRHEVPATHGLRRYWDKIMMNTKMKKGTLAALVTKEYLMGHSGIVKTDKNYFWADIQDQVPDYLQAMPELMITNEFRLQHKIENQEERLKNFENNELQLQDMKEQLAELIAKVQRLDKYSKKTEIQN